MKIGKTLGIGSGTVQRVLMEQPRPFDVDAAEAALALNETGTAAGVPRTIAGPFKRKARSLRDADGGGALKVIGDKPIKFTTVHIVDKGAPLYDKPK